MRLLSLITFALSASLFSAEPYPLWDGQESVATYAQKVNLPPTQSLDLGNGVKLDLGLIPAGTFIMGTPEPTPVDEESFHTKIITGQALLALSAVALLVMLTVVLLRAIRQKRRPQMSLGLLLLVTVAAGGCVLSGMHWRHSVQKKTEYESTLNWVPRGNRGEKPTHQVTLTQPYYMGKYVVTQEQYLAVIGQNPSRYKRKDNPVDFVSWDDAQAFCKKLSEQTKQPVRLPTEAEWEYACRAGTTTAFHSGDTEADWDRVAWHSGNSENMMHPVGQKEANAFGLYDMHGGVVQWCQDWYYEFFYAKSVVENPQGPGQGDGRVLRGCRSACRMYKLPNYRDNYIGFRVVLGGYPVRGKGWLVE